MGRPLNFAGNIVTYPFLVPNTEFPVPHGLNAPPSGVIVIGQSVPGRIYRTSSNVGGLGLGTSFIGGWEFENALSLGTDSGPSAIDLTNSANPVTQAVGKVGNAGNFVAASSQFLTHASAASLQTGDIDFTFAAWIYFASKPGTMGIIYKSNETAGNQEYGLSYAGGATDRLRFQVFRAVDTAVTAVANTLGSPALATWYFVIGWHDAAANTVNIQVNDGAVDSTATGGALQAPGAAAFQLGAREFTTSRIFWDGRLDQVMFWKRVLTAAERTALYNIGSGVTVSSALAAPASQVKPWTATSAFLKSSTIATYRLLFFA